MVCTGPLLSSSSTASVLGSGSGSAEVADLVLGPHSLRPPPSGHLKGAELKEPPSSPSYFWGIFLLLLFLPLSLLLLFLPLSLKGSLSLFHSGHPAPSAWRAKAFPGRAAERAVLTAPAFCQDKQADSCPGIREQKVEN